MRQLGAANPATLRAKSSAPGECVRCHDGSPLAKEARRSVGLYDHAPALDGNVLKVLKPFDPSGLRDFLTRPVARRNHVGSMYPVAPQELARLMPDLQSWTTSSDFLPQIGLVTAGEVEFQKLGCAGCHSGKRAPGLPIGRQLFNFQYFKHVVSGGTPYYADPEAARIMPKFPNLSEQSLENLYSYISLVEPTTTETVANLRVTRLEQGSLYDSVTNIFKANGCIHCHGANSAVEAANIFGGKPEVFLLSYQGGEIAVEGASALKNNSNGKRLLLQAVENRADEVYRAKYAAVRGMPMTLPPLSRGEIQIIKQWLAAGCPKKGEHLCEL